MAFGRRQEKQPASALRTQIEFFSRNGPPNSSSRFLWSNGLQESSHLKLSRTTKSWPELRRSRSALYAESQAGSTTVGEIRGRNVVTIGHFALFAIFQQLTARPDILGMEGTRRSKRTGNQVSCALSKQRSTALLCHSLRSLFLG